MSSIRAVYRAFFLLALACLGMGVGAAFETLSSVSGVAGETESHPGDEQRPEDADMPEENEDDERQDQDVKLVLWSTLSYAPDVTEARLGTLPASVTAGLRGTSVFRPPRRDAPRV
jgi:hypothetical protein